MAFPPRYKYRPKFHPGQEDCVIQDFVETRGRLDVGGSFFRSAGVGSSNNNITIQCIWLTNLLDVSNFPIGVENVTTDINNVNSIRFNITNGPTIETYYETQKQGTPLLIPPPTPDICDLWTPTTSVGGISAIPALRIRINSSSVILEMPERGIDRVDSLGVDGCYLEVINITNLISASGGPDNPDTSPTPIRTGPERSIIYISQSEIDPNTGLPNLDGALNNVTERREWNGFAWVAY